MKTALIYLLVINIVAFFVRGWDKYQARRGGRRISEKKLLKFCWLGGRIGGLLGMEIWRHKTIKGTFLKQFRIIVLVHFLIIIAIVYSYYAT